MNHKVQKPDDKNVQDGFSVAFSTSQMTRTTKV